MKSIHDMSRQPGAVCEPMEQRVLLSSALSFASAQTVAVAGAAGPLYAGKFHGNGGSTDLAISTGGAVQILNGSGSGSFTAGQSITLPASPAAGKAFLVGDYRGNGQADIVLLSQSTITGDGLISFEQATGAGTFLAGPTSTVDDAGAGFEPITAAVGDFNGDGAADLAILGKPVRGSGLVMSILISDTDGTFTEAADYPVAGAATSGTPLDEPLIAASFAGSHVDLALDDGSSGHLDLFLGNGDGTFAAQAPVPLTATLMVSTQLTGSGHLDLLAASGTRVTPLLGNGDGTFTPGASVSLPATVTAITAGDIDLDGNRDVVTNAGILRGLGDGAFAASITPLPVSVGSGGTVVNTLLAADVTGDGRPDVVGFAAGGGSVVTLVNTTAAATATSINSAAEPANPGQDVKLTATVSSALTSPAPAGTVSFFDGVTALGSASLGAGGKATFDAGTGLALGQHPITAVYAGNGAFAGSTSAVFTQDVLAPTVTTLAVSENPADVGDPLTFTATVSGNDGQGDVPTGDVAFFSGSASFGAVAVGANGLATLVFPTLPTGTASITAQYQGDDLFATSASAVVSELVQPAPLVPVVASSTLPSTVVAGSPLHRGLARITLKNQTAQVIAGPVEIDLFASQTAYIGSAAHVLNSISKRLNLKPGATLTVNVPIASLPAALVNGSYLLLARATAGGGASNASNTGYGTQGPTLAVTAADTSLSAALSPRGLLAAAVSGTRARAIAAVTVTDSGNVPVQGPVTIALSFSPTASAAGPAFITVTRMLSIKPGASKTITIPLQMLPAVTDGSYFLVASVTGPIGQTALASSASPITLAAPFVALVISAGPVHGLLRPGGRASVIVTLGDIGNAPATGAGTFTISLLAADNTTTSVPAPSRLINVAPAGHRALAVVFALPPDLTAGSYTLTVTVSVNGTPVSAIDPSPFLIG